MNSAWTRRAALAAICSSAALLAACGSGSVAGAITPARFISVGDGFADVGQNGYRFTVNDGTNNWTQELASHYSLTLTAASSGGWSYAQGDARVDTADTTSGTNAPSVKDQIDTLLARVTFADDDIVLVGGGIADIVNAVSTTGISSDTTAAVSAAGTALGAQVRRLVTAGAQHVVIAGVYNLGISPWARNMGQGSAVESLTTAFNDALLVSIVDLGANVLYVDAAYYFNLLVNSPTSYGLSNSTDVICTSVDSGNGIGIGTGQVNSSLCNSNTLVSGADATKYVFADPVYFTPVAHRLFGTYAYDRVRARW